MNSLNILVEAKKEYTNQLQKILTPRIYEGFKSIYEEILKVLTDEIQEKKTQSSSVIKTFQKTLKEIPQWNQEMINNEYNRIEKTSNCDYFDNLIEAVFITNTKILTSVQINDDKSQNIKINIPQSPHFIHKCYMECAKEIYKNPYIFDQSKNLLSKEKHINLRDALHLIDNSINNAIRELLPIRDILMQGITKNNISLLANLDKKDFQKIEEKVLENEDIKEEHEEEREEEREEEESENDEEEDDDSSSEEIEEENNETIEEINQTEEKNEIETKEIFLNNITQTIKKINSIEKIEENKELTEDIKGDIKEEKELILEHEKEDIKEEKELILEHEKEDIKEEKELILEDEKEDIKQEKNEIQKSNTSPFIRNIKQKKFLKNKYVGMNKNSSFYKKKYEENSANIQSLSEQTKDNIENTNVNDNNSVSNISKNKIILEGYSSNDDISEEEVDI